MRKAAIYYKDEFAGFLTETDEGEYMFQYDEPYVAKYPGQFLTFTMPVMVAPFKDRRLFPFFEGLIPEGWLLDIASKSWKISQNDKMGLLMACCGNCIGAVSVQPVKDEDE
jgi:serine/threonine-protein kinase HipA